MEIRKKPETGWNLKYKIKPTFTATENRHYFNPAGNYMFKANNRNTRTRCEICSKLTIKTPERR